MLKKAIPLLAQQMAELPQADAEQAMIARVFAPLAATLPGAFGLQDDAAVLSLPPGRQMVVTMDTLVADVHFLFDGTPQQAADAAYKALAVNVSDLAAKAADPVAYLLSLTLPAAGAGDWLPGLAEGLRQGQAAWNIDLAGGDTVRGRSGMALTITAIGSVPEGTALLRSRAQPGDRLVVSGTIGDAWAGLQLCRQNSGRNALSSAISGPDVDFLIDRYQRPKARTGLIDPLRRFASAAMDISDGLLLDLERLCRASRVGAILHADRVPLSPAVRHLVETGVVPLQDPLSGGDDYEILAAVPAHSLNALLAAAQEAGLPLTEIGEVTDPTGGVRILNARGETIRVTRKGWDHLSDPLPDLPR